MIHFIVDLKPHPKERPRFNRNSGQVYTPTDSLDFESHVKFHAQCKIQRPFEGAVSVKLVFNFEKARTSKLIHHTKKPDLDNLEKSILDALNEVAWKDDCQVVEVYKIKKFAVRDSVEIFIKEFTG